MNTTIMKRPANALRIMRSAVACAFCSLFLGGGVVNAQEGIGILHPRGGEKVMEGDTILIVWDADSTVSTIDLKVWNGRTSSWSVIATDLNAEDGEYEWVVPSAFGSLFRIGAFDTESTIAARSGTYFSVLETPAEKRVGPADIVSSGGSAAGTLLIVPNPASAAVTVRFDGRVMREGRVLDLAGQERLVVQFSGNEGVIDAGDLPAGMYLVEVMTVGGDRVTERLIVRE